MVSAASFQVGCRSYIPFVVDFAHNDVNDFGDRTCGTLWNSRLVYLCEIFTFSVNRDMIYITDKKSKKNNKLT